MFNRWSCKLSGVMLEERFPVNCRVCDETAAGGPALKSPCVHRESSSALAGAHGPPGTDSLCGLDGSVGMIRRDRVRVGPPSAQEQSFMHPSFSSALNALGGGVLISQAAKRT